MEANEPSPLDFDSLGAEFIFIHQHKGAQGLKARLAEYVATDQCRREWLQQTAAELAAMGLLKPARLVAQAAAKCPSMLDFKFCTYNPLPTDPRIIAHWREREQYRVNDIRRRAKKLLRQAGLDLEWLDCP